MGHVIEVEAFVVQHGDQLQATVVDSSQLRLIPLGELPVLRPTETAALRRARDQLVVVTGKVSHADYFEDSKDVYLVLEGPPRDSVFLAIKAEEWSRLAGSAAPSTFVGRQLQAQVVPQPEARELRLQVADADALKVVRD